MHKAIICDWSGTLSNNFQCFSKVCTIMFNELGREPITDDEIRLHFTLPYMTFWNKYFPKLTKEKQCTMYEKLIHQAGEPKLYKQVNKTLQRLHSKGYKIFIVSSDPLSKLIPEVEKSGLMPFIEKVIGNIHEKGKVIAAIVKEYNLDTTATFYVGDTSGDIEAGKKACVKTVGISWGYQHKKILSKSKPDYLIDSIDEIKEIIENN